DGRRLTPGTRSGTRGRDSPDPKPCCKTAGAAKAVDGYENPLGRKARGGSSPPARTKISLALASKPKSLRVTMIPLRRRGWHHPARADPFEPFSWRREKSGTPAPAPAAKDGTILIRDT